MPQDVEKLLNLEGRVAALERIVREELKPVIEERDDRLDSHDARLDSHDGKLEDLERRIISSSTANGLLLEAIDKKLTSICEAMGLGEFSE